MEPTGEEINQLLNALEGSVEEVKEDGKDEVQEEKEVVEESDDSKEEETSEEQPAEEEVEEAEEPKEDNPPPADDKDATIATLRAQIEELSKPKPEEKKEEVTEPEPEIQEQDFVSDIDIDEVSRDPKLFNSLLNKVYAKATKDVMKVVAEANAKTVPDAVVKRLEEISKLKAMHDQFYAENPQLANFKKVVAAVFNELQAEGKGKSYDELLTKTAEDTYKRLGLKKEPVKKAPLKEVPKLPSKSKGGARPGPAQETKGLQSEIDDLLKSEGA